MTETAVPDLRETLFGAQEWYAGLLAGVSDDQLGNPTPCPEFDVRALVAHMSTVLEKVVAFGSIHRDPFADHDRSPQEIKAAIDERAAAVVDGRSADDRASLVRQQIQQARESWTDDVLDTPIQLGWGPILPGRIVAAIYTMEVLAHAWDLATATGQPSEAPPQIAAVGLEAAKATLPAEPRGMAAGIPFGPAIEPAADAGPTEQMVNWTGRASR